MLFLSVAFLILHTVLEVSGEWKLLSLVMDDASTLPSNLLYHAAVPYSTFTATDASTYGGGTAGTLTAAYTSTARCSSGCCSTTNCQKYYNNNGDPILPNKDMVLFFGGMSATSSALVSDLYSLDISSSTLHKILPLTSGSSPSSRMKFASCSMKITEATRTHKYLFIHGGYCSADQTTFCGDFLKYEIPYASQFYFSSEGSPNKWTTLTNSATLNRAEHSIACDKTNKRIWLFGGKSSSGSYMSDLWYYDISTGTWTQQTISVFSSATRTLTLWDGSSTTLTITKLSELQSSDTLSPYVNYSGSTSCVNNDEITAGIPTCRSNHQLIYYLDASTSTSYLYLIGGENTAAMTPIQDTWQFDIAQKKWTQIGSSTGISGSYMKYFTQMKATLTSDDQFIFHFGGYNGSAYAAKFVARSTLNNQLSNIQIAQYTTGSSAPTKVIGFAVASLDSGIALVGGCESATVSTCSTLYWLGTGDCTTAPTSYYSVADCYYGSMVCTEGYWGTLCNNKLCPGSACFNDTNSIESAFCYFCYGNGTCSSSGVCTCTSNQVGYKYTGDDCSIVTCGKDCNSSNQAGTCQKYYPVSACQCTGKRGGDYCDTTFCLNDCSGKGTCTNGTCSCSDGYTGSDCSVFVIAFLS